MKSPIKASVAEFARALGMQHEYYDDSVFWSLRRLFLHSCNYRVVLSDAGDWEKDRREDERAWSPSAVCIIPVTWHPGRRLTTNHILRRALLYSDGIIAALPRSLCAYSAGYSDGGKVHPDNGYDDLLCLNKQYANLLADGELVFLPQAFSYQADDGPDHVDECYELPLLQTGEGDVFTRLNSVDARNPFTLEDSYTVLRDYLLPFFPHLKLQDAVSFRKNECELFSAFQPFVDRMLTSLLSITSPSGVREILGAIEDRVQTLTEKARLVGRRGLFSRHRVAFFPLALAFKVLENAPDAPNVAGIVGSRALARVLGQSSHEHGLHARTPAFHLPLILR